MLPERFLSIAPMMEYTDRHDRYFLRLMSKHTWLYTEMLTTNTLIHGDAERFLQYNKSEHPLALQLGGSDPKDLAICSKMANDFGYDEINLNIGCPSDRVKSGRFGASLMADPLLVARCVEAMQAKSSVPVTVKCRLGIDDQDEYGDLKSFIQTVAKGGCQIFIIHARKAWLQGLSPKENRDVPPLNYEVVYRIKREFPELQIIINGGLKTLENAKKQLEFLDGAMIGREAYHNPYILAHADQLIYGDQYKIPTRKKILEQYLPYVEQQLTNGINLTQISRHLLGLFQGLPGAKAWRRHISENAYKDGAGIEVIEQAQRFVCEEI